MSDREAQFREMAKKTVFYRVPGMEDVAVERDVEYQGTGEGPLPMDVYLPSSSGAAKPPVVVIVSGYPDPLGGFRKVGWHISWARMLAASGVAVVIYGNRQPAADIHAVLKHVRDQAESLGVDAQRVGLLACSAHGPVALSALMQDARLKCAALLYTYTMDLDGSQYVANIARQYGCADACAGKSVADLPAGAPLLFVRAGRDQFPGINEALDRVVAAGLGRNLPISLVNHHTAVHAFDLEEDSDVVRHIVRQVLAFLCLHLEVR
jgi:acetyl esterase/lipase